MPFPMPANSNECQMRVERLRHGSYAVLACWQVCLELEERTRQLQGAQQVIAMLRSDEPSRTMQACVRFHHQAPSRQPTF